MINLRPMTGGLSQVLYASNRSAMLSSKIPQALAVHVWPGCTGIASVSVPVETIAPACSDGLCGSASSSGARPAAGCRAPARRRRLSLMACTNSSYVRRTTRWLRQIVRCATLRPIATGMQSIVFDPTHPNNLPFPLKRAHESQLLDLAPAQCYADITRYAARKIHHLVPQLVSSRTQVIVPELIHFLR